MPQTQQPISLHIDGKTLTVFPSYIYCGICGHTPQTANDEPNYAPIQWWDPDDGWKIGTLCQDCAEEYVPCQPQPNDYAVICQQNDIDDSGTDEDPTLALYEYAFQK